MSYNKSQNTYVRTLYSEGFSSLMMSFYRTNLTLNFVPYTGKDNRGLNQYSKTVFLSTSINYEGAAALYLSAIPILEGKENQSELVLPCRGNAALVFEYKPDPNNNNQMRAYLSINKNNGTIPFRFSTFQDIVIENGQKKVRVVQTGLGVFSKTLDGYLTGIGADLHLSKLSEEELDDYQNTPSLQ